MLRLDDFAVDGIDYGFFGRSGGISGGVFASLNCTAGQGDADDAVRENRQRVLRSLGSHAKSILTLKQVHSNNCHVVTNALEPGTEGDALVTSVPGTVIGVLTADCAPVLFTADKAGGGKVIGAAHAGWGGAVKGVLEATLNSMRAEGAVPETIRAAIGPCIAQPSYEVSPGFEKPFLEEDAASHQFFRQIENGKQVFDLPGYVKFRLNRAGIVRVGVAAVDTYSNPADWFSFRRSTHKGESQYGRQISAISIRNS